MDKDEKKCCSNCKYFHIEEEYWYDHYLIPAHMFCSYYSMYNDYEVKSNGCCENFELRIVKS